MTEKFNAIRGSFIRGNKPTKKLYLFSVPEEFQEKVGEYELVFVENPQGKRVAVAIKERLVLTENEYKEHALITGIKKYDGKHKSNEK